MRMKSGQLGSLLPDSYLSTLNLIKTTAARKIKPTLSQCKYGQWVLKLFTARVRSTREGNVLTRVCPSVCPRGGVSQGGSGLAGGEGQVRQGGSGRGGSGPAGGGQVWGGSGSEGG